MVFTGPDEQGVARYQQLVKAMRQGEVRLLDQDGTVLRRQWAPNLRSRW